MPLPMALPYFIELLPIVLVHIARLFLGDFDFDD